MQKTFLKRQSKSKSQTRSKLDWEVVRRRIDEANQKLLKSEEMSAEALEQAWAKRAKLVGQKIQETELGEMLRVALIGLDNELYGLDVRYIFDIRNLERVTLVPRVPNWVIGVVNWRGRILSVIDLRRYLGLPVNEARAAKNVPRMIVVQDGEMEVGIQADEVFSIESIPASKVRSEDGDVRGIKPEFVTGIFIPTDSSIAKAVAKENAQESIVVLLNLPALLSDPHLIVRDETM
jgi:purine-binding chemotaxis protein CheW